MFELISFIWGYVVQTAGLFIAFVFAAWFIYLALRHANSRLITWTLIVVFLGVSIFFYVPNGLPNAFQYPFFLSRSYGPGMGPVLSAGHVWEFFTNFGTFERVVDIARDPNDVPPPITRTEPTTVHVDLTAKEVITEIAPGVHFNAWTFDGKVPGPMLRVMEGDTVMLTLHNDETSIHSHSIDLHAVLGPGGGAAVTAAAPGEQKTLTFKALRPGLYVYHCAYPNVANHMAHGMYGMILVEPKGGLPKVDKEFYIMQGEYYTVGGLGRQGLQVDDTQAMLDGKAQYIIFNGRVGALSTSTMQVAQDQSVRMYVGNGGVNLVSSFHVIGEIFEKLFIEGSLETPPLKNAQTTTIPAGGAAVVEFTPLVPGNYILVDHALARMDRGAWGMFSVSGTPRPEIYDGTVSAGSGH